MPFPFQCQDPSSAEYGGKRYRHIHARLADGVSEVHHSPPLSLPPRKQNTYTYSEEYQVCKCHHVLLLTDTSSLVPSSLPCFGIYIIISVNTHYHTLSLSLSVCVCVCVSVSLSFFLYSSARLPIYPSTHLPIYPSTHLPLYIHISISIKEAEKKTQSNLI